MQKELQNVVKNNLFLYKSKKTTTTKQIIKHKIPCRSRELNPSISHKSGCVTTAPPSPLRVMIVVKLFNCFHAMGRNFNKQNRICGPYIFYEFIFFCYIVHAWITIFGSFSNLREYVTLLKYG